MFILFIVSAVNTPEIKVSFPEMIKGAYCTEAEKASTPFHNVLRVQKRVPKLSTLWRAEEL